MKNTKRFSHQNNLVRAIAMALIFTHNTFGATKQEELQVIQVAKENRELYASEKSNGDLHQQKAAAEILQTRAMAAKNIAEADKLDAEAKKIEIELAKEKEGKNKNTSKIFNAISSASPKAIIMSVVAFSIVSGGIIYAATGFNIPQKIAHGIGKSLGSATGDATATATKEFFKQTTAAIRENKDEIIKTAGEAGAGVIKVTSTAAKELVSEAIKEILVLPTETFASGGQKIGSEICTGIYNETTHCPKIQTTTKVTFGIAGSTVWPILGYLAYLKYLALAAGAA